VPLNTVALATIPRERMGNATALLNVVRNLGGAIGVALLTTLLARRSQAHQAVLVGHVDVWDTETAARLQAWASHFVGQGADHFTAERRAVSVLYQEVTRQAQLLAFADDFWVLFVLFCCSIFLLPMLQRVRIDAAPRAAERAAPTTLHAE
jgi:MFS transporter, DHA2 family, multidrug resistance protein